ncbi:MAG: iron-sulfur cluster assembly accessory protein [Methylococcales bacterium]|nr:iron-sulfur cluster assembly accessory protein [Methylococcales bacterium]
MSMTLTEQAAKQIQKQLSQRGQGLGLRIGVKKSGCSGYAYTIDYADAIEPDEVVFEQYDVKLISRRDDLDKLNGLELDYRREGINEAFRFDNPNVKGMCGCGESFTV